MIDTRPLQYALIGLVALGAAWFFTVKQIIPNNKHYELYMQEGR